MAFVDISFTDPEFNQKHIDFNGIYRTGVTVNTVLIDLPVTGRLIDVRRGDFGNIQATVEVNAKWINLRKGFPAEMGEKATGILILKGAYHESNNRFIPNHLGN